MLLGFVSINIVFTPTKIQYRTTKGSTLPGDFSSYTSGLAWSSCKSSADQSFNGRCEVAISYQPGESGTDGQKQFVFWITRRHL